MWKSLKRNSGACCFLEMKAFHLNACVKWNFAVSNLCFHWSLNCIHLWAMLLPLSCIRSQLMDWWTCHSWKLQNCYWQFIFPLISNIRPYAFFVIKWLSAVLPSCLSALYITLCLCVDVSMTNSSACHHSSESFISLIRDAFIPFEGLQTPQQIEGFLQTDG